MREERITTRGAVVRELPAQRDAEVQAVAAARDATTESAVVATREVAVQAEPVGPESDSPSTEDGEAPIVESPWDSPRGRERSPASLDWSRPPEGPSSPEGPEQPDGCWNCGSRAHVARECPRAITEAYCFRCGTRGYTVKTCPHCRQGWLAQGPYMRGRGHQGPDPPRGRRARNGTRPVPY